VNIVFDLDGTLADCEHRRHLVTPDRRDQQWDAFYALCWRDLPIYPIIRVYQALAVTKLLHIEIWSARREDVREMTEEWLYNNVWNHKNECPLLMRPRNNTDPDVEIKRRFLTETKFPPNLVFDDRRKVVEFWRSRGIMCAQVAEGAF
jgi:hypothetical protein